jgi:hypothetical protein
VTGVDKGFWIQTIASLIAVAVLIIAAWAARVSRPFSPLDPERARSLLAVEFPGKEPQQIWTGAGGHCVIAKAGDQALLIWRLGDGWVARQTDWPSLGNAKRDRDHIQLSLNDLTAPVCKLDWADDWAWPPAPTGVSA